MIYGFDVVNQMYCFSKALYDQHFFLMLLLTDRPVDLVTEYNVNAVPLPFTHIPLLHIN